MGAARNPQPVKLIAGILAASPALVDEAQAALQECFGIVDAFTPPVRWTVSDYYVREMGPEIWRQFVTFAAVIAPGALAEIKERTNVLEQRWTVAGGRRVNIDPGYLDLTKLVLASTKDAAHRVYLGRGIYAESTLHFANGSFRPYEYTYPDYAAAESIAFFNRARRIWREERAKA